MAISVHTVIAVLFAVVVGYVQAGNKLPSYIKTCHRNDPKVEDCILASVESLRPMLVKGIPELEIPALDPMHLGEINIDIGGAGGGSSVMGGAASFKAHGKDVVVHGASDFSVSHLRVDLVKHLISVHVELPWLMAEGVFDFDGKFLVLPIRGRGPFRSNATKVKGELVLKSGVETYDGVEHLTFTSAEVDLKVGGFSARLSLYNDPVLSEAANMVLATNPQEFLGPMMPVLETTLGKVFLETANKMTRNYSFAEIFPKR